MTAPVPLPVQPLSRVDFAGFGDVIETRDQDHFPVNNGTSLRFDDLARIDVSARGGVPGLSIFRASRITLPLTLTVLERHPLSTQAFMPLGRQPFLVVVAPPGEGIEDVGLRAFVTDGSQGVNYHRGVWHHALLALEDNSEFLVIDRRGPGHNCDILSLATPRLITAV